MRESEMKRINGGKRDLIASRAERKGKTGKTPPRPARDAESPPGQGSSEIGTAFRRISKCARLMRRAHARCVYKAGVWPGGRQSYSAPPGLALSLSCQQWYHSRSAAVKWFYQRGSTKNRVPASRPPALFVAPGLAPGAGRRATGEPGRREGARSSPQPAPPRQRQWRAWALRPTWAGARPQASLGAGRGHEAPSARPAPPAPM